MKKTIQKIIILFVILAMGFGVFIGHHHYQKNIAKKAAPRKVVEVKNVYKLFGTSPLKEEIIVQDFVDRNSHLSDLDKEALKAHVHALKTPDEVIVFLGKIAQLDSLLTQGGSLSYRRELYEFLSGDKDLQKILKIKKGPDSLITFSRAILSYTKEHSLKFHPKDLSLYYYLESTYGVSLFEEQRKTFIQENITKESLSILELKEFLLIGTINPSIIYQNNYKFKLENQMAKVDSSQIKLIKLWKYLNDPN